MKYPPPIRKLSPRFLPRRSGQGAGKSREHIKKTTFPIPDSRIMPRPKNDKIHAIAERFGVTTRTVRNWEAKGYPLEDEEALCGILIGQHSRAPGVDRVAENREPSWRDVMSEDERDVLVGRLASLKLTFTALRGEDDSNWPWPFGGGPKLTPEEEAQVIAQPEVAGIRGALERVCAEE